jgi:hypothetical protein
MRDLFISCAKEDEAPIATPLADALRQAGLSVSDDNVTLDLGDDLEKMIDNGLEEARHAVVLLTPAFFAKSWALMDMDRLVRKAIEREIIPVWHAVTAEQATRYLPALANETRLALAEGEESLDEIAQQISALAQPMAQQEALNMSTGAFLSPQPNFLYQRLVGSFSLPELHAIASRFQVDEPTVESKPQLAEQMVTMLDRHGRLRELDDFVDWLRPSSSY